MPPESHTSALVVRKCTSLCTCEIASEYCPDSFEWVKRERAQSTCHRAVDNLHSTLQCTEKINAIDKTVFARFTLFICHQLCIKLIKMYAQTSRTGCNVASARGSAYWTLRSIRGRRELSGTCQSRERCVIGCRHGHPTPWRPFTFHFPSRVRVEEGRQETLQCPPRERERPSDALTAGFRRSTRCYACDKDATRRFNAAHWSERGRTFLLPALPMVACMRQGHEETPPMLLMR